MQHYKRVLKNSWSIVNSSQNLAYYEFIDSISEIKELLPTR